MKRNKVKKLIVFTSAFAIAASGITYTLLKKNYNDYEEYLGMQDKIVSDEFLISAHRGFSSLAVENSKEAIILANSKNYIDYIEIDVRETKDNKLILSHDNDLFTNERHVRISDITYDEAVRLNLSYKFAKRYNYWLKTPEEILEIRRTNGLSDISYNLIGLDEALELADNKGILLDIKFDGNIYSLCNDLINYFKDKDTNNIIFQSLDIEGIRYLKNHSNFDCQVLVSNIEDLSKVDDFDRIGLNYYLLNEDIYKDLSLNNKKLSLWTINNSKDIDMIVDIVGDNYKDIIYITNYPDVIVTKLNEINDNKVRR